MDKRNLPNPEYARVVRTPLKPMAQKDAEGSSDPFRRPANEDDDGYDPYSDRPANPSGPEEDPWR